MLYYTFTSTNIVFCIIFAGAPIQPFHDGDAVQVPYIRESHERVRRPIHMTD